MKFELFTNLLTCPSLFDPPLKSNTESTKMQQKKTTKRDNIHTSNRNNGKLYGLAKLAM